MTVRPCFVRCLTWTGLLIFALKPGSSLIAQETKTAQSSTPAVATATPALSYRTLQGNESPLPAVFQQRAPKTVVELKAIEDHVTALFPKLAESTVHLSLGGRGGSQGSGVIVSRDGIILTAAHVVGPPGRPVTILTQDGHRHNGISLGRNTTLDGALVRFVDADRTDWPAAPVAQTAAQAGDWCAVLGHPGGYQKERGVVLRFGQVVFENEWIVQTDCELVGGDSGGPLFNMRGEVIGINTRIGESTEFNIHVPIDVFTRDWKRLLNSEEFRSHSGAYLGVTGVPATSGEGLLVERVIAGSPADKEGLKAGDVLLTFQGDRITSIEQLTELIGRRFPGQTARITLLRNGETLTLMPRLGIRNQ